MTSCRPEPISASGHRSADAVIGSSTEIMQGYMLSLLRFWFVLAPSDNLIREIRRKAPTSVCPSQWLRCFRYPTLMRAWLV